MKFMKKIRNKKKEMEKHIKKFQEIVSGMQINAYMSISQMRRELEVDDYNMNGIIIRMIRKQRSREYTNYEINIVQKNKYNKTYIIRTK